MRQNSQQNQLHPNGADSTLPFLYAVAKAGRKSPEPVKDPLSPQLG